MPTFQEGYSDSQFESSMKRLLDTSLHDLQLSKLPHQCLRLAFNFTDRLVILGLGKVYEKGMHPAFWADYEPKIFEYKALNGRVIGMAPRRAHVNATAVVPKDMMAADYSWMSRIWILERGDHEEQTVNCRLRFAGRHSFGSFETKVAKIV